MGKDSEKLIRQLSLISFLMAESGPVTAVEIQQEVQGYTGIVSDEAFNRRFYADRADLASHGIALEVIKPGEGSYEAEAYTLSPEGFYLPAIDPTDAELAELNAACEALGEQFAYAEPLRLLLERLEWVRTPASHRRGALRRVVPRSSQALTKLDTAIHRRKVVKLDCRGKRLEIEPYHLYFTDRFHLVGRVVGEEEIVVIALGEVESKIGYATKAERDFPLPEDFDAEAFLRSPRWLIAESLAIAPESSWSDAGEDEGPRRAAPILPSPLARLAGLARILIDVAGSGGTIGLEPLCARLGVFEGQLRQDLDVLNVVNFGGGNYVLYAEVKGDVVEAEAEVHADVLARPMRILPLEARALVGAIDLVQGEIGGKSLLSLRSRVIAALGGEPPGMHVLGLRRGCPVPFLQASPESEADRPAVPDLMGELASRSGGGGHRGGKTGSPAALMGRRRTTSRLPEGQPIGQ